VVVAKQLDKGLPVAVCQPCQRIVEPQLEGLHVPLNSLHSSTKSSRSWVVQTKWWGSSSHILVSLDQGMLHVACCCQQPGASLLPIDDV
jgi:hypothetical protein